MNINQVKRLDLRRIYAALESGMTRSDLDRGSPAAVELVEQAAMIALVGECQIAPKIAGHVTADMVRREQTWQLNGTCAIVRGMDAVGRRFGLGGEPAKAAAHSLGGECLLALARRAGEHYPHHDPYNDEANASGWVENPRKYLFRAKKWRGNYRRNLDDIVVAARAEENFGLPWREIVGERIKEWLWGVEPPPGAHMYYGGLWRRYDHDEPPAVELTLDVVERWNV